MSGVCILSESSVYDCSATYPGATVCTDNVMQAVSSAGECLGVWHPTEGGVYLTQSDFATLANAAVLLLLLGFTVKLIRKAVNV